MSDLFDRAYTCPVCGNAFTSKQVKTSAIRTKERKKDFHALFSGENPTFYGIICCEACGYAKFESDFKQTLKETEVERVKTIITAHWNKQCFTDARDLQTAIRAHTIAIASYKVTGAKHNVYGKLYLRLAWFYDEAMDIENHKKYLKMALDAFISSYELEKHNEDEREKELEIMYLIGEINRQLGNYKEAIRWFDLTVRHDLAYKNRLIKNYAKEQWALAAEEHNASKGGRA